MPGGYMPQGPGYRAAQVIDSARRAISPPPQHPLPPPRPSLTDAERRDLGDVVASGGACKLCGTVHAAPSTPACPRLATFRVNGAGQVVEGSFWADWDASRVLFPEEAAASQEEEPH